MQRERAQGQYRGIIMLNGDGIGNKARTRWRTTRLGRRRQADLLPVKESKDSANGHAFSVAAHPHILKLLERLNSGEACAVKNLMEEYAGTVVVDNTELEAAPEDIQALLVKLYSLRAITIVAD